jgi:hypothetical protein
MDFSARRLRFGENADSLAAHALLKSTPQRLAGERRAVARGRSLAQAICGLDVGAQAAVGAGNDVFLADDFSERDEWVFEAKKRFGMPPLLKPRSTCIIVSCTLS